MQEEKEMQKEKEEEKKEKQIQEDEEEREEDKEEDKTSVEETDRRWKIFGRGKYESPYLWAADFEPWW